MEIREGFKNFKAPNKENVLHTLIPMSLLLCCVWAVATLNILLMSWLPFTAAIISCLILDCAAIVMLKYMLSTVYYILFKCNLEEVYFGRLI